MKLHLAIAVAAAAVVLASDIRPAEAQVMLGGFDASSYPAGYGGAPTAVPAFSYSYAMTAPYPARAYVPYGASDPFPFYGEMYGHPYDRWSWASLSGYQERLSRYYYPPLR